MFRLPYLLDPPVAPTAANPSRRAAGPFTPRNAHLVTQHGPWYRYVPESGNWHGGTSTRWIAALSAASQIPEPRKHGVHYFGTYASRSRVFRKKRGITLHSLGDKDNSKSKAEPELSPKKRAALRKSWAQLIKRVYQVDPLKCDCGGTLRVIGFITEPVTYCS